MFRASGHTRATEKQLPVLLAWGGSLEGTAGQVWGVKGWGGQAGDGHPVWDGVCPALGLTPIRSPQCLDSTLCSFPEGKRAKMKCWPAEIPVGYRSGQTNCIPGAIGSQLRARTPHWLQLGFLFLPGGDTLDFLNFFLHPWQQVSQKGCYSLVLKIKQQVLLAALLKL